jgi:hypothetical protein
MLKFQPSPYSNVLWPTSDGQAPGVVDYGAWTDYVPGASYAQAAGAAIRSAAGTAAGQTVRAAQTYLPESIKAGLGVGTGPDFYARNAGAVKANSAAPFDLTDGYAKLIWWVQLARNRADFDGRRDAATVLGALGATLQRESATASAGWWCLLSPSTCTSRYYRTSALYTRVADAIEQSGLLATDTAQIVTPLRRVAASARTWELVSLGIPAAIGVGAVGYLGWTRYRKP